MGKVFLFRKLGFLFWMPLIKTNDVSLVVRLSQQLRKSSPHYKAGEGCNPRGLGLCQPRHCQAGLWGCTRHLTRWITDVVRAVLKPLISLVSQCPFPNACGPPPLGNRRDSTGKIWQQFANPNSQAGAGVALPSCLCPCCKGSL